MLELKLYNADSSEVNLPFAEGVKAGFPSPAEGLPYSTLNITSEIIKNPASTFYARVSGDSMKDDGISDGDILVVDKSVEPYDGCTAICFIDGEFTLKHIELHKDYIMLVPANDEYKPIRVEAENEFSIWGIVRYVIKKIK